MASVADRPDEEEVVAHMVSLYAGIWRQRRHMVSGITLKLLIVSNGLENSDPGAPGFQGSFLGKFEAGTGAALWCWTIRESGEDGWLAHV